MSQTKKMSIGLIARYHSSIIAVPLKSVRADVLITNVYARVRIQQTYKNDFHVRTVNKDEIAHLCTTQQPPATIECTYNFPIDPKAALLGLRVIVGDKTVIDTEIRPNTEAKKIYETAVRLGTRAVLMQQTQVDVATVHIGNLAPYETAVVEIEYASELVGTSVKSKPAWRFVLPTTIAPRYGDRPNKTGEAPVSALIVPEHWIKYKIDITANIRVVSGIDSVSSPSHPNVHFVAATGSMPIEVTVQTEALPLVKDFVIVIVPRAEYPTLCGASWSPNHREIAICNSIVFPNKATHTMDPTEFVLVIDKSGSMLGEKMQTAKDAAILFLNALPQTGGSKFGVITFSDSTEMFSQVMLPPDNADTMRAVKKWITEITPNGGTETSLAIQRAQSLFASTSTSRTNRAILVLTDGEMYEPDECMRQIALARQAGIRTFVLGIGNSVSRGTLMYMATMGGAVYDTVMANESILAKTLDMLTKMQVNTIQDVHVNISPPTGWHVVFSSGPLTQIAGIPTHTYVSGVMYSHYTIIAADAANNLTGRVGIDISYTIPETGKRNAIRGSQDIAQLVTAYEKTLVSSSNSARNYFADGTRLMELVTEDAIGAEIAPPSYSGWMHALSAKARVNDLVTEDLICQIRADRSRTDEIENAIRNLGLKYSIMTPHTSFVGVSKELPRSGAITPPVKVYIPIALTTAESPFTWTLASASQHPTYSARKSPTYMENKAYKRPYEQMVVNVLLEQTVEGSWTELVFANQGKGAIDHVVSQLPSPITDTVRHVVATCIVLQWLTVEQTDLIDIWQQAVAKATTFLNTFDAGLITKIVELVKTGVKSQNIVFI